MRLRANAIEFIFDKELARHRAFDVRQVRGRRCQHELQWMKQAHFDITQSARPRAQSGFADVAAQHVRHRHVGQRLFEGARDRIFDQTFA